MSKKIKKFLAKFGFKRQRMSARARVIDFIETLRPRSAETHLIRIGGSNDGGYLLPDDFDGLAALFSPGVAESSRFEREFADRGIDCFLADYSVDSPAEENDKFFFEKKFLGASSTGKFMRLEDWVKTNSPEPGDLVLQMDIEGAEYEIILDTPRNVLSRFRIMVIEFHRLDMLFESHIFPFLKQAFAKLLEDFVVVHIHPNNRGPIAAFKNIEVPHVLEITFHRKDRFKATNTPLSFPHKLDETNVPGFSDVVLPPIWYYSMNFFEMCQIQMSPFNIKFARKDPDWNLLKDAYEHNLTRKDDDCRIPKIIHFIWVGSKLPDRYRPIIQGWKDHNPEFAIWLWDDERVEAILPKMINKELYEKASSFGNKSDILRCEILKRYGGLYADVDFLCNGNFSQAHDKYCFYAGISLDRLVQTNNGLMASMPNHPIIDIYISQMTLENPWEIASPGALVLYQTGPWALTRSVLQYMKNVGYDGVMIYPSTTFHPFPNRLRHEATDELVKSYYKPWTMACHLWHTSWQPGTKHYIDRFAIKTNHQNPPHNYQIFEEYFYNRFSQERPKTKRKYLPICWTNYYVSKNYCKDDMSDIQDYLNSLDRGKKYFTVCQWDDGIRNNTDGLDIFVYASGGVGDYAYPLNCMPHGTQDNPHRTILASFIGVIRGRHPVRESMYHQLAHLDNIFISESSTFEKFQQVLTQSIFALCPRGYGRTSFRICESLEAGIIPVYIYDEPWIPFEDELDFEEYGVLCSVNELPLLHAKLSKIAGDTEQIQHLTTRGGEVYRDYYSFEGCYEQIIKRES